MIINRKVKEQFSKFKYLGCSLLVHGMNELMDEDLGNIQKCKLNGCRKRKYGTNVRNEIQQRIRIAPP
jgi:hypothetical protein